MGMYLVDAEAEEWLDGPCAAAFDEELARRGLPPYVPEPAVRGSGAGFEEKLVPRMDSFGALCREVLGPVEEAGLFDWTELVPVPFDGAIGLPFGSAYSDRTVIVSAHRLLPRVARLAEALELPEDLPGVGLRTMQLTCRFLDFEKEPHALAGLTGRWTRDLPAALYVAMYLRAARHCLRTGHPLTYC
ncbi:hypothetical protein ACFV4P_09015 [Kitasatospora sp. NPDC059795]|uniref:hypothetical protein n=1 Tax=Kitasatospora sp. NPDC059795 TaxID=3346949 RepID=UPI0036656156